MAQLIRQGKKGDRDNSTGDDPQRSAISNRGKKRPANDVYPPFSPESWDSPQDQSREEKHILMQTSARKDHASIPKTKKDTKGPNISPRKNKTRQTRNDSPNTSLPRERGGLVVNASDSGSRGRGFEPHSGQTVLCP